MLFHVLGPVEAHTSGGDLTGLRARKPTAVLATLLLHANRWVRVDSFLFIDRRGPAVRSDRSRLSEAESSGSPTQRPQESDEA